MNSTVQQANVRSGVVRQLAALAVAVVLCLGVAAAGGALTASSLGDWYPGLAKPGWTTPDWLFGPVWTLLYLLMAVAAWLVWRDGRPTARGALVVFGVQLGLNLAWSAIFFWLRSPGWGLVEVIVLWLAILATLVSFWRHSRLASSLL